MVRISQRKHWLQPSFVMRSPTEWLALMRDGHPPGKIGVAHSTDAGAHWNDLPDLALDNPDAAIAALSLSPRYMALLHNSSVGSRAVLDWSASSNGQDWQLVQNLARGATGDEFSYPSLVWSAPDQHLWVSFTMNRKHIAWQRFTPQP
jgi:predicted neuraminidase